MSAMLLPFHLLSLCLLHEVTVKAPASESPACSMAIQPAVPFRIMHPSPSFGRHSDTHASNAVLPCVLPQIMWAACVYLEAVSVLPQLRMMQNAKVVEKFTAHYVFALGLSRFISCAHWILQIIDGDSFLLQVGGEAAFECAWQDVVRSTAHAQIQVVCRVMHMRAGKGLEGLVRMSGTV